MNNCGYFIFSLDTELALGRFDRDKTRQKLFSTDGVHERATIARLIDLFEEFNIVGTWALVGHLFYAACEDCEICPMEAWREKYKSFKEVYQTSHPLWYGSDIVDNLLVKGIHQEIGFHGYSHMVFDENLMSPVDAKIEVKEWLRVSRRRGIVPRSVAFPRNKVGHLKIMNEEGVTCYRGVPQTLPFYNIKFLGKLIKNMDKYLGFSNIPVFDLVCRENCGLVVLPPSEYFFDLNRHLELFMDFLNLHKLRTKRMINGIKRAATEKKMIHLWAHPCEFHTEKDFAKLRQVFMAVSEEVVRGRMRSVGMSEMARLLRENFA